MGLMPQTDYTYTRIKITLKIWKTILACVLSNKMALNTLLDLNVCERKLWFNLHFL